MCWPAIQTTVQSSAFRALYINSNWISARERKREGREVASAPNSPGVVGLVFGFLVPLLLFV